MMKFEETITNVDDLINGYVIRDGFVFTKIDEPTNVFDALLIRNPTDAKCPVYSSMYSVRTMQEHIELINKFGVNKALIIADNINFIAQCPSIRHVELVALSNGSEGFDYSALYKLSELESLILPSMPFGGITAENSIDYSMLNSLRKLRVSDVGSSDPRRAEQLRHLVVSGVKKGCVDASTLFSSKHLEELSVIDCGLKALTGIEHAENLCSLQLGYDRALTDISSIESCADTLRKLSIQTCPKISDFSFLSALRNLEHLELLGNNDIEDLEFLKIMTKLKTFSFSMNVVSGDLTPCLDVPFVSLEKSRKHYNLKDKDLPKRLLR